MKKLKVIDITPHISYACLETTSYGIKKGRCVRYLKRQFPKKAFGLHIGLIFSPRLKHILLWMYKTPLLKYSYFLITVH